MHVVIYTAATAFGGAETVARSIVANVVAEHRVTVVGPNREIVAQIAAGHPLATMVVSPRVAGKRDVRSMRNVRAILRDLTPDVVHVNLTDLAACLPETIAAATLRGAALVVVEHSGYPPQSRLQRWAKVAVERVLDGHVAVSRPLADLVATVARVAPERISVIVNGVDPVGAGASVWPIDRVRDDGVFRIGVVARLTEDKGVDLVIDALRVLPDVELHVVGDGPAHDLLREHARREAVDDRVHFHGWLSDPSSVYRSLDAYVHPSRAEIMPLSVMEAMHHGLAVVATDVGSVADIVVADETGLLFAADDGAAFVAAIESLRADPARRRSFGDAGRARALRLFTAQAMSESYLAVYADARRSLSRRRWRGRDARAWN